MATSQDFVNWVCSDKLDPRFLQYLFIYEAPSLTRFSSGAVHQTIYFPEVKAFHICMPPIAEQQRIVAVLDEAFAAIATATSNAMKNVANARELFERYLRDVFVTKGTDWLEEPLAANVKFIDYRGKTPPKRATGIRLITAKNVKMGHLQREPEEFIDAAAYEAWMTRGIPKRGDVLFTTEAPLGNVAQLDTDEKVVIGQRLITMKSRSDRLNSTFLKYMLCSAPLQDLIHRQATGATVSGIKAKLLKLIPISYPLHVEDQHEIVRRLDCIHDLSRRLRTASEAKIEKLATLKQSFLNAAFNGELPSTNVNSLAA